MIIRTDPKFDKHYSKRIAPYIKLDTQFQERLKIFIDNPAHPLLKLHKLTGKLGGYFSFSITGDIRVLFEKITDKEIILYDIGSHNQVY